MKIFETVIAGLALTLPGVLTAQEVPFSIQATDQCVAGSDMPEACIGRSSEQCISTPAGGTTVGMVDCLSLELKWWDARLNAVYKAERAKAKSYDAALAGALRDMQRAWVPYRDATCRYEAAQWGGGSGAGPAYVGCQMRLTAEQALYLERSGLGG